MSRKDAPPETATQSACRAWWTAKQPHVKRAWGRAKDGYFFAEESRLLHEAWEAAMAEAMAEIEALKKHAEKCRDLHRRCQKAESALVEYRKLTALPPDGDGIRFVNGNSGRILLSGICEMQADEIEALREQLSYELPRARRSIDVLELQLRHTESQKERLTRILAGIHALLYPADKHVDGKTCRFTPPPDGLDKWMHALSERIRALPAEIDAAMASGTES